jgi:hypothetical protein
MPTSWASGSATSFDERVAAIVASHHLPLTTGASAPVGDLSHPCRFLSGHFVRPGVAESRIDRTRLA